MVDWVQLVFIWKVIITMLWNSLVLAPIVSLEMWKCDEIGNRSYVFLIRFVWYIRSFFGFKCMTFINNPLIEPWFLLVSPSTPVSNHIGNLHCWLRTILVFNFDDMVFFITRSKILCKSGSLCIWFLDRIEVSSCSWLTFLGFSAFHFLLSGFKPLCSRCQFSILPLNQVVVLFFIYVSQH